MIRKKVRGFRRRAGKIRDYVWTIRYVRSLYEESRSISNEAAKYHEDCDRSGIEYIPDKVLPKELLDRIKQLDIKLDNIKEFEMISKIRKDFKSGLIFISLKGGFKIYDHNGNNINYDIIEGNLVKVIENPLKP